MVSKGAKHNFTQPALRATRDFVSAKKMMMVGCTGSELTSCRWQVRS